VVKHWRIDQLQNLSPAAEQARDRAMHHIERLDAASRRMVARRERRAAPAV